MAKTGPGSAHRHKDSRWKWSDKTDTESGSLHDHPIDFSTITAADAAILRAKLSEFATDADVAALDERVDALEDAEPIPTPEPGPGPEPPPQGVVSVGSPSSLIDALSDNAVTSIKGVAGTWPVSGATGQKSDSLWIGRRTAARTNPVTVDLAGVTLDGRGAGFYVAIAFEEGAHDQSWIGWPKIGNGNPTRTGAILFGGYSGPEVHGIRFDVELLNTLWATSGPGIAHDHGVYFSSYSGYGHEINIRGDLVRQAAGKETLDSFIHADHGPSVRDSIIRAQIKGTPQAILLYEDSLRNVVFEDTWVDQAEVPLRWESGGPVVLRRFRSTNSKVRGFVSNAGKVPTYEACRYDGKEFVLA